MLAIVPAAGGSRRMGTPKLLLPLIGTTVLGATIAALRDAGVERCMVVTAPADTALRSWAAARGLGVAVNPAPERGMVSSVWAAIEALGGVAAFQVPGDLLLVTPGDLPLLRASTVASVIAAIRTGDRVPLAQPRYRGRTGHPLAIATALVPDILGLDPAIGLRQLRDRHAAQVAIVEVDDPGCVRDVDTPEDYAALQLPAADQ